MEKTEEFTQLRGLAERTVPRYTSYPTAPHFGSDVDAKTYGEWLAAASSLRAPLSLYLHVPFCRSICHYCACNTKAALRDGPIRDYARLMLREIALVADITGRMPVSHIHWGGGTPGLLPADCLEMLVEKMAERFELLPGLEHAIELDPRHVTADGVKLLARLGITRASLGVQDLDPQVQEAIGRVQPFETVARAVDALRREGISALNFDVMYGLPRQNVDTIVATANRVVGLGPDRIALFGYAHVPWMKTHQRLIDEATLPTSDERIALARAARETFRRAGYAEIGIDHFALPGDPLLDAARNRMLRRNFQGYTTDSAETLIGLGASSIGRTPSGMVQNASDIGAWRRTVEAGQLPVVRDKAFEGEDLLRAAVIEELLASSRPISTPSPTGMASTPRCLTRRLLHWTSSFARDGSRKRAGASRSCVMHQR
jgi:oxygen-independent coproporphyrinogen III oxidase